MDVQAVGVWASLTEVNVPRSSRDHGHSGSTACPLSQGRGFGRVWVARLEGGVPLGADSGFCSPSAGGAGAADRHRSETVTRPRADRPEGAHGHHLSTAHPHLPRGPGERTSFPQSVSAAHACTSLPTCWQNITLNKGREKQRFAKKKMRSFLAFIWLC